MKQFILVIVLFSLPILVFPAESRVQKYFQNKEYAKILQIIDSKRTNDLYGAEDYTICGHVAFMYGLYEESCSFYQKVVLISKNSLGEEDLINYAFALIKLGKGNQVLTDACFKIDVNTSSWLVHLRAIASTRNSYIQQKDSLMNINKLKIDFLPQYGLDYLEDQVYYSYSRFPSKKRGGMPESETIMDRRGELAGIESMKVEPNGKSVSPTVLKKSLKGVGRIASVNLVDKGDNFFATVVDRKGGFEQILVHGNLFPAFAYNSQEYACAMPFFSSADQRLYFCSNMPGGFGGWDIYYSEFKGGEWKYPVNMGSKVNTPFDEFFPSVYKDLLIFASEAREGKGGFDNYSYSPKTGIVTNLWPFNTTGDDYCLKIIQDKPLKAIGVNVANANFYSSVKDLESILNQNKKNTIQETPSMDSVLVQNPVVEKPVAETPRVVAEAPKPASVVTPVEKKAVVQPKPLSVKNVKAQEVQAPEVQSPDTRDSRNGDVFLGTLHYDLNNSVFKSNHYAVLDSITQKIRAGEYVNIIVWGFTDRCGAEAYNGNLSYQRAIGVVEYLRSKFCRCRK